MFISIELFHKLQEKARDVTINTFKFTLEQWLKTMLYTLSMQTWPVVLAH